jgi:hypothetical protein
VNSPARSAHVAAKQFTAGFGERAAPGLKLPRRKRSRQVSRRSRGEQRGLNRDIKDTHCCVNASRRMEQVDRRNLCVRRWFRSPRDADTLPLAPWWRGRTGTRELGDVAGVMWCRIACPSSPLPGRLLLRRADNLPIQSAAARPARRRRRRVIRPAAPGTHPGTRPLRARASRLRPDTDTPRTSPWGAPGGGRRNRVRATRPRRRRASRQVMA